jgi:hypothetical protein
MSFSCIFKKQSSSITRSYTFIIIPSSQFCRDRLGSAVRIHAWGLKAASAGEESHPGTARHGRAGHTDRHLI